MEAYLQVQNLQDVITTDGPSPKAKGYDAWKKMNVQVLGLLKMTVIIKLHYLIGDNAKTSWDNIKTQFDTPSILAIFNNFRACSCFRMNPNSLMKDLGKLNTMFNHLAAYGEPVSSTFQAIMVIAAFPASWDNLASMILATHTKATLTVKNSAPIIEEEHKCCQLMMKSSSGGHHVNYMNKSSFNRNKKPYTPKWQSNQGSSSLSKLTNVKANKPYQHGANWQ
ncbi:hypothetical protein AMATHDRAFT_10657 [Amanita thiersii Skay4041]|uniref:Retrotransposon Copia-like N-terminal domain-containing protein n=1 Tax=Amanita thiersii Skay4041 TaxID=703135 RepID=A0A2A9N6N8_9AGAR|nr:hypothetical protein AMATHDRAFT_10657 [Amanita thiersii Skay4041]